MTIHYHGTPISPIQDLLKLAGRHFCVSFADKRDVERVHKIGQSVLLDNGAYSLWKSRIKTDWNKYYEWTDIWLDYPTTWAIIPDVIDGTEEQNDNLIKQWPHQTRGAPVWHLHERLDRLKHLTNICPKVCLGSSGIYSNVNQMHWRMRMDQVFNLMTRTHRRMPWLHMLRGMKLVDGPYPFASVDSATVARNHNEHVKNIDKMIYEWDGRNCPGRYVVKEQRVFDLGIVDYKY